MRMAEARGFQAEAGPLSLHGIWQVTNLHLANKPSLSSDCSSYSVPWTEVPIPGDPVSSVPTSRFCGSLGGGLV